MTWRHAIACIRPTGNQFGGFHIARKLLTPDLAARLSLQGRPLAARSLHGDLHAFACVEIERAVESWLHHGRVAVLRIVGDVDPTIWLGSGLSGEDVAGIQ